MLSWSHSVWLIIMFHMNIQIRSLTIKNYLSICFIMCLFIMLKDFTLNWCNRNRSLVFSSMFIFILIRKICLRVSSIVVGFHCNRFWKITVSPGTIWLAHVLRILFGIPSGPESFNWFAFEQSSSMVTSICFVRFAFCKDRFK